METPPSEQTSVAMRPSLPLRIINRVLTWRKKPAFDLSAEGFKRRARLTTRLKDFGPEPFGVHLEELSHALTSNPNLSALGQVSGAGYFHFRLENKLRLQKIYDERPELDTMDLGRPIFIVGWYRTGTTLLHTVLSADERHRSFTAWELLTPFRVHPNDKKDTRKRRRRGKFTMGLGSFIMPEVKFAHPFEIEWPEEDFFMLENDLIGPTMIHMHMGYDYAFRLMEWDKRQAYRNMRRQMALLHEYASDKQLVMKAPIHLWMLGSLVQEFPDARFVFTHRDPVDALVSNCSLSAMTATKASIEPDLDTLGAFWRDYYVAGMEHARSVWDELPEAQRVHLPLTALSKDPVETVRRIYAHFDLPFDDQTVASVEAMLASGVGRSKGKHRYSAAQFGLDEAQLREAFEDYYPLLEQVTADWEAGARGPDPAR